MLSNELMNDPIITIENLEYAYPDGPRALDGINLEVFEGEKVALAGRNGAGKSTLLLAIGGFIPFSGRIEIGSIELNNTTLKMIRRKIGIVFQNPDHQIQPSSSEYPFQHTLLHPL